MIYKRQYCVTKDLDVLWENTLLSCTAIKKGKRCTWMTSFHNFHTNVLAVPLFSFSAHEQCKRMRRVKNRKIYHYDLVKHERKSTISKVTQMISGLMGSQPGKHLTTPPYTCMAPFYFVCILRYDSLAFCYGQTWQRAMASFCNVYGQRWCGHSKYSEMRFGYIAFRMLHNNIAAVYSIPAGTSPNFPSCFILSLRKNNLASLNIHSTVILLRSIDTLNEACCTFTSLPWKAIVIKLRQL